MCVAPAVAFATGGATLSTLTGLPYLLCTLLIGAFIFIVAIFGTDLVRKVASVLSVCIIAGRWSCTFRTLSQAPVPLRRPCTR